MLPVSSEHKDQPQHTKPLPTLNLTLWSMPTTEGWGVAQSPERLPSTHEALDMVSSTKPKLLQIGEMLTACKACSSEGRESAKWRQEETLHCS